MTGHTIDKKDSGIDRSRRALLQGLAGAGLYAGLGGSLGGAGLVSWAGEPLSGANPAGAPRRGGRIRVATTSSSTADTLDPARGATSTDYVRHYMIYSGLTQFDGELEALPGLAESFETDDQILWTFKLRSGVEFHDGKPLTADDVVYSLLRHQDPSVGSKSATVAAQFAEARATGPLEVQLRLTGPNVDLPKILASSPFVILQDGTRDFATAVGTGPYRLKEFTPGVRTIVTRNENYWKPGRPYLDEIELVGISDETSRVNALLSGDIQLTLALDPRSIRRVRASAGHEVLEAPSGLYTNLIMRQDMYPGSNPDFIMAIKYLFDRELVKRALFRGVATIANDHPVPPFHRYYAADLPVRPHNLDRAAYHLKKSGMAGARFPLFCSPVAMGSVDMASLLQLSAAKIGLNLGVNRMPADGYWSNHWAKHPLSFGNVNPRPSLDLLFSLFYKSTAPWNESAWKSERFDQLLLAARAEGDDARRKQMYVDMQELIHNECGLGIPVFLTLLDGYDTRLGGLGVIPIGGMMGYSFAEHVWWRG